MKKKIFITFSLLSLAFLLPSCKPILIGTYLFFYNETVAQKLYIHYNNTFDFVDYIGDYKYSGEWNRNFNSEKEDILQLDYYFTNNGTKERRQQHFIVESNQLVDIRENTQYGIKRIFIKK